TARSRRRMVARPGQLRRLRADGSNSVRILYLHYLYGEDTALAHVRQFAQAARELGHSVEVAAMNLAPPEPTNGAARPVQLRLREQLKGELGRYLHEVKELAWNARYYRRELALVRTVKPDVLLVRDHLFTAACVPVAWRSGVQLVLEVNSPAEESRF